MACTLSRRLMITCALVGFSIAPAFGMDDSCRMQWNALGMIVLAGGAAANVCTYTLIDKWDCDYGKKVRTMRFFSRLLWSFSGAGFALNNADLVNGAEGIRLWHALAGIVGGLLVEQSIFYVLRPNEIVRFCHEFISRPGRVQDVRVAVTACNTCPDLTVLPGNRLGFTCIRSARHLGDFIDAGLEMSPLGKDGLIDFVEKEYIPMLDQGLGFSGSARRALVDFAKTGIPHYSGQTLCCLLRVSDPDMRPMGSKTWRFHDVSQRLRDEKRQIAYNVGKNYRDTQENFKRAVEIFERDITNFDDLLGLSIMFRQPHAYRALAAVRSREDLLSQKFPGDIAQVIEGFCPCDKYTFYVGQQRVGQQRPPKKFCSIM